MSVPVERRSSPAVAQVVLVILFAAIAVVGVLTVLVPELSDDGDAVESGAEAPMEEPAEESTPAP